MRNRKSKLEAEDMVNTMPGSILTFMPILLRISVTVQVLLLAAGCVSLQTESTYDLKADFSELETFAWLDNEKLPGDHVRISNEAVQQTVRDTIEQTLVAKGYRTGETESADFVVSWVGAIEKKIKKEHLDHLYSPYGYGTLFRDEALNPEPARQITEYEEGTLIIDLLDPVNQRLLWRGTGVGRIVPERPPETALRNLAKAVVKILEPIPSR